MGQKGIEIPIIPYKGIRSLAIARPFFDELGWNFFMEAQEIIIYRLMLKNPGFGPYLLSSIFGP